MAWYCISFGLIARYHTVMYRCYSAPANYRVVHLVIFMYIVFFLVAENNVILVISVMQSMLMDPNYYRDNVIYVRNA